jgi:DNA-binding response OmpR family regulator
MLIEMSSRKRVGVGVKRTALLVEDDPRLQGAMRTVLARMDFDVLSASHYDAAVGHLALLEPQLVCVDVGLPNKSGYEVCEYIRRSRGFTAVPILVMSEYGHPEDMAHAEDAGGNAFLRKPFSMSQLTNCIRSLLDQTRRSARPVHELQLPCPIRLPAVYIASPHVEPPHRSAA